MMKGVRRVIQSTVIKERKEDYRNGWVMMVFFISKMNIQYTHLSEKYFIYEKTII